VSDMGVNRIAIIGGGKMGEAIVAGLVASGFAAAADIIGSYPWAVGPVLTLVCGLSFAGWFVAVGSQLFRMRGRAA